SKAWCSLKGDRQCKPLVETQNGDRVTSGKVTIQDDARRGCMSITVTNLQAEDSGTYFCA
ncbi:CLM6 protein, partial [Rhinopomastus cyanomelas]|nr:CLM6 protein [Rhinopomastus cyanomelas]